MDRPIHICRHCRHFREPVRPSAFAPGAIRSGGQFGSATRELTDGERDRSLEEMRFNDGLLFDSPPQFFAWCARFTLAGEEIEEINRRLRVGDNGLARTVLDRKLALLDSTRGVLIPLYALCDRRNRNGDCDGFEPQTQEAS
jgi:hypothetical protein